MQEEPNWPERLTHEQAGLDASEAAGVLRKSQRRRLICNEWLWYESVSGGCPRDYTLGQCGLLRSKNGMWETCHKETL